VSFVEIGEKASETKKIEFYKKMIKERNILKKFNLRRDLWKK
jgi:hypothetical protein